MIEKILDLLVQVSIFGSLVGFATAIFHSLSNYDVESRKFDAIISVSFSLLFCGGIIAWAIMNKNNNR